MAEPQVFEEHDHVVTVTPGERGRFALACSCRWRSTMTGKPEKAEKRAKGHLGSHRPKARETVSPAWLAQQAELKLSIAGVKAMEVDLSGLTNVSTVELRPEPTNEYNPSAILVLRPTGEVLGYIPDRFCTVMTAAEWTARILQVHEVEGRYTGVLLMLRRRPVAVRPADAAPSEGAARCA